METRKLLELSVSEVPNLTVNTMFRNDGVFNYTFTNLERITHCLTLYVQPTICLLGVIGNVISLIVFLSRKLRNVSCNVYLAALSVSNSAFMLALFVVWLEFVGIRLIHTDGWCQSVIYVAYVSSFLSVWLIVCITVENFIITFYLHEAPRLCTVRRALVVVGGLTFFGLLLYDFALWSTKAKQFEDQIYCLVPKEYGTIVAIFTCIDVILTLILPSLLIVILLICIVVKSISQPRQCVSSVPRVLTRKERALLRVTRLLFVIIVSFMVLTSPTHVNKLRHLINMMTSVNSEASQEDKVIQHLCQLIYYMSFSCNFIYFLLWGKNFRRVLYGWLKAMGRCCKKCFV
ncbi:somatostatin receptor type 4-like [Gigantopelta aegis]|uniref:somatostatin receptor type 4-like n=1 Tax=Gigantopelta aegis TaxID=1735272 RepID=UPI001B889125|nr:somatostatin receptor type 4-like [Gigantopelta aegis]